MKTTFLAAIHLFLISLVTAKKGDKNFYKKCSYFRRHEDRFACATNKGMCVSMDHYCDSFVDCMDGSDEDPIECEEQHRDYCDNGFEGKYIRSAPLQKWQCKDDMCIEKCRLCDKEEDCLDGSDEDPELCANKTLRRELDKIDHQCQRETKHKEF